MGTKRAKGGHLAPGVLKVRRAPGTLARASPRARLPVFVDKLLELVRQIVDKKATKRSNSVLTPPQLGKHHSMGGADLLKWCLPGEGSNLLKSRRPLTYVYYPRVLSVFRSLPFDPRGGGEDPLSCRRVDQRSSSSLIGCIISNPVQVAAPPRPVHPSKRKVNHNVVRSRVRISYQ